ncbi:MAG: GNAT family N-acetyltransferase [Anaerolineae bacterium]
MTTKIRTLRVEEFEDFMRYVERAFGHSVNFFRGFGPHIYEPIPEVCSWGYVMEEDGKIVSHVGVYPIEVVTAGVPLTLGGIGAVSTAMEARGRGYMTQLLYHAIDEMRAKGYPASWLGGDRQRYNTFGWEVASLVYRLSFSRRSLGRTEVSRVPVEEVVPWDAKDHIAGLMTLPACHVRRPRLDALLHRRDLRVWINEDGYAIADGQERGHVRIIEIVSASGEEAEMIHAIIAWNHGDRATVDMSPWDEDRLARMMPYTHYWSTGYSGMYRINDLTALLQAAQPFMQRRAASLRDFAVAIGMREHDRTPVTTIAVQDGEVTIQAGQSAESYVELTPITAARLFFGGPAVPEAKRLPQGLLTLLPVPIYVPPLDHV